MESFGTSLKTTERKLEKKEAEIDRICLSSSNRSKFSRCQKKKKTDVT